MDTEKQLKAIENELKALKANYPIAASKVKFYTLASQEFSISGRPTLRIKFKPNSGLEKNQLTTLRAIITIDGAPAGYSPFVNEPQDGSGEVVLKVQFEPYSSATIYKVKVIASGTSLGTFSVL